MTCTICGAALDPTEHREPPAHKGPRLCSDDCCEAMIRRVWARHGLVPEMVRECGIEDGHREARVRLRALSGITVGAVWAGRGA